MSNYGDGEELPPDAGVSILDKLRVFLLEACDRILSAHFMQQFEDLHVSREELVAQGIDMSLLYDGSYAKPVEGGCGGDEVPAFKVSIDATIGYGYQRCRSDAGSSKAAKGYLEDPLFNFFKSKLLALRIWQEDDLRLFDELKKIVQTRMDAYASICHYKFDRMAQSSEGIALTSFREPPVVVAITRQDHEAVRAVRVDDEARRETGLIFYQAQTVQRPGKAASEGGGAVPTGDGSQEKIVNSRHDAPHRLNEDVFITQLHVRAQALHASFQDKIQSVLRRHACGAQSASGPRFSCVFSNGAVGSVDFFQGNVKSWSRIHDKLVEYEDGGGSDAGWPLTGNILDPVRLVPCVCLVRRLVCLVLSSCDSGRLFSACLLLVGSDSRCCALHFEFRQPTGAMWHSGRRPWSDRRGLILVTKPRKRTASLQGQEPLRVRGGGC